jgi:hypothetical protein
MKAVPQKAVVNQSCSLFPFLSTAAIAGISTQNKQMSPH